MRQIWAGPEIGLAVRNWKLKSWNPQQENTCSAKEIPRPGTSTVWIAG